jgi:hypothetical protein
MGQAMDLPTHDRKGTAAGAQPAALPVGKYVTSGLTATPVLYLFPEPVAIEVRKGIVNAVRYKPGFEDKKRQRKLIKEGADPEYKTPAGKSLLTYPEAPTPLLPMGTIHGRSTNTSHVSFFSACCV